METHTPGEWSCDYGDFCVFSDRGGQIAEITAGRNDDGSTIGAREMEANMRLIAAAPLLLEVLRRGSDAISAIEADLDESDIDCYPARHWWQDAERVIAKAEGRAE